VVRRDHITVISGSREERIMKLNLTIIESPRISIEIRQNEFGEDEKEKIRDYFEKTFLPHFGKILGRK